MITYPAYIALGSNVGDRAASILDALRLLDDHPLIQVRSVSQLIRTAPVGGPPGQPSFLNAAAELRCRLDPHELLDTLLATETALGRTRTEKWGPRTIDLDLLLVADRVIDTPRLHVPHPLMHRRRFVLEPLAEIAPHLLHPLLRRTIRELLDSL